MGTAVVVFAPLVLIVLPSYLQLNPYWSGYDVGSSQPMAPPDLAEILWAIVVFGVECVVVALLVAISSLWVRVEFALALLGVPLFVTAAIGGWWRLAWGPSLVILAAIYGVLLVLYGLDRLISPKTVAYEPVVLMDSDWDVQAEDPEAD
jgi:hypothetical protein